MPAVTRHAYGDGAAFYLATRPDPTTMTSLLARAAREARVAPAAVVPAGVEVVRRGDRLFVLNHTDEAVDLQGTEVLAGDVAVLDVVAP